MKKKDVSNRAFAWFLFKAGFQMFFMFMMCSLIALFDGNSVAIALNDLINEILNDDELHSIAEESSDT